jgi:hypothetical protein
MEEINILFLEDFPDKHTSFLPQLLFQDSYERIKIILLLQGSSNHKGM